MRFMVIVKATSDSEAGVMPSGQLLTEMGNYNEQLMKAGIMPKVKPVPDGMHSITPHLVCAGAADAIEFYKKAFNAEEGGRLP